MFGAGGGTSSYREIEDSDVIVLWGSNARNAHPIFFHHVLAAVRRGAKLFVIDPRRSETAAWADLWLGLDVGTDIALANTMAREIIARGLHHRSFIERATADFDAFAQSVQEWTLERGEAVTGVPAWAIAELAHAYARADRAQLCWTLGITEHHNATDNVLALINLALLCGHVGRYGSGLNPLRGQNNVQGGGDMGAIPNRLPGFQDLADAELRAPFEAAWDHAINPVYGMHLTAMFEAMGEGRLGGLYVVGENPAQSEADVAHALDRLAGLEHLVVQDIFRTKTAELAHVVLPATASWCEAEGTVTAQNPAAGAQAAKGSAVRINISKGTGLVTVPNVVGQPRDDAESEVTQLGLKTNTVTVPSPEPAGTVVAQNPIGGQLRQGESVRLNVSAGP